MTSAEMVGLIGLIVTVLGAASAVIVFALKTGQAVGEIHKTVSQLETVVDEIAEEVLHNSKRMSATEQQVSSITATVEARKEELNRSFQAIDNRFSRIEDKLDQLLSILLSKLGGGGT